MRALFECVAMAIKNKGVRGLCELVPGGQYLLDVCSEAFKLLRERQRDRKLREELAQVAAASAEEARKTAEEVARQVVGEEMSEEKVTLELYLAQIPGAVRASLKRSDDPTGRTVPPGLAINTPGDLARLLPQRAPQFRPGADLPGARAGNSRSSLVRVDLARSGWCGIPSFPRREQSSFAPIRMLRTRLTSHEGKVIARVMGHRNHPNVVPLLDAILDGETPWLMYEYVGGGDLAELIHEWQQFTPSERESLAVDALHQLAAAVGTFHRLAPPIVHRDLKPANILVELGSSGDSGHSVVLRITDFGIGGVVVDALHAGQPAGTVMATGVLETSLRGSYTPLYASPQQRAGNPPDPRDDVHALGVIGFHMMTGRLTESPGIDAVDDLRESGVSDALTAMIAKCVASKAERRPKDAGELAEQLRGLSKSSSVPRSKPATDQPVTTKPQRSREAGDRPIQSSAIPGGKAEGVVLARGNGQRTRGPIDSCPNSLHRPSTGTLVREGGRCARYGLAGNGKETADRGGRESGRGLLSQTQPRHHHGRGGGQAAFTRGVPGTAGDRSDGLQAIDGCGFVAPRPPGWITRGKSHRHARDGCGINGAIRPPAGPGKNRTGRGGQHHSSCDPGPDEVTESQSPHTSAALGYRGRPRGVGQAKARVQGGVRT